MCTAYISLLIPTPWSAKSNTSNQLEYAIGLSTFE